MTLADLSTELPLVDLDAYFDRIGYDGSRKPTQATLEGIVLHHVRSIPFENLNSLLGQPVRTELPSIQAKLVFDRRGGYCYEQNLLLLHVLWLLGYRANGLAARVLWGQPDGALPPRSHMLLRVEMAGRAYLVDVGFGGMTPTAPLLLQAGIDQATPHEAFRLVARGAEFELQTCLGDEWKKVYRFDLQEQAPGDYAAANWWVSTHPESLFTQNLFVSRVEDGKRIVCLNGDVAIYRPGQPPEKREIRELPALREFLEQQIRLPLAGLDRFDDVVGPLLGKRPW
ncbi:MAG TPA: arylamine N-acetyltransferase [Pirellulaceae bacterium]|jgi:N-hydroxyarylamine O-acetyltransferase|nr:arylamine N-acetyltransferase [Pirellulaceae bacterium]